MGLKAGGAPSASLQPRLRVVDTTRWAVVEDLPGQIRHHPGGAEHAEYTGATAIPGGILQTTRTEVLWLDHALEVTRRFSHPLLHDVHDACLLPDGGFAVAASGHESVLEFADDGSLVHHHWLRDGTFSDAYPGVTDFRAQPFDRFKPHSHHPNHVFVLHDALWVTVFESFEARSLVDDRRIPLPEGRPHDGVLAEGLLWFTTVNGHVIAVDPHTLVRVHHLDVNQLDPRRGHLGWCRGLAVVGRQLFVGMTMLRGTRHRELLRWLAGAGPKHPTRLVQIDLDAVEVVRELTVGNEAGGTLYAITPLD